MTARKTASKPAASTTTRTPAKPAAATTTAPAALPLIYIQPPPASANIPVPPAGAAQPGGANYRSVVPKTIELAALPAAVENMKRLEAVFMQIFGAAGLPYAQVFQAFDVGNQWSTMRQATALWDTFSRTEEGICWGTLRSIMDRLGPLWAIASAADPSLAVTFPALATLFGAKKAIAQKAVSTKRLNKEAVARGEQPTHGQVGKRRQKAEQKALAAAATAAGLKAGAAPTVAPPPAPPAQAPSAPVAVNAAPAAPAAATGVNGAGHA